MTDKKAARDPHLQLANAVKMGRRIDCRMTAEIAAQLLLPEVFPDGTAQERASRLVERERLYLHELCKAGTGKGADRALRMNKAQGNRLRLVIGHKLGAHNMRVSVYKAFAGKQLGFESIPRRIDTGSLVLLTRSERRVFRRLAHGWTIKQLAFASEPKRSIKTFDNHRCNIMAKLKIYSQLDLVLLWFKLRMEFPQC